MECFTLTLTCIAEGEPHPFIFRWMNIAILDEVDLGCTKKQQTQCSLILFILRIFHTGTYECLAQNSAVGAPVNIKRNITVFD